MVNPMASHSAVASNEVARDATPPIQIGDTTIARAVAAAVRGMSAVSDLSPGLAAVAATYGPRERIAGVVVHHPHPHDIIIEVHVILCEAVYTEALAHASSDVAGREALADITGDGVLVDVADQIRGVVNRTVRELNVAPPAAVDVLIDDIRTDIQTQE